MAKFYPKRPHLIVLGFAVTILIVILNIRELGIDKPKNRSAMPSELDIETTQLDLNTKNLDILEPTIPATNRKTDMSASVDREYPRDNTGQAIALIDTNELAAKYSDWDDNQITEEKDMIEDEINSSNYIERANAKELSFDEMQKLSDLLLTLDALISIETDRKIAKLQDSIASKQRTNSNMSN